LFATGVGGVFYPPKSLHPEVLNKKNLIATALKADDVWLKFMSLMNNTPVVCTKPYKLKKVRGSQKIALNKINVGEQRNDLITSQVLEKYNRHYGIEDTLMSRIENDQFSKMGNKIGLTKSAP
jgi:hypothetical protein